ncbi:MAG: 3-isopropylmalate dehydrogenase [Candidatus Cyclobacteriaceae bacterium M3_2C_046]
MASFKITVLPGDGIGGEVTSWGIRVLEKTGEKYGHQFTFQEGLIGHAAIEKTGSPLPDQTLSFCRDSQAVLMGAVGDPRYDLDPSLKVRPEQGLLKIRKELGLYANLRPIKIFDELIEASSLKPDVIRGADILFFRELTGGIYFGQPSERRDNGNVGLDTMIYSREEVSRIAKMAFEAASKRSKKVCSVDKANVLESSRLWREVVNEVARDYPDIALTHMFVDNAAMQLIKNPLQFDVVVTGNMFGDILTDEASQISGSLGLLPSASVGSQIGLYEPVHGSAPDIAGKNLANPMALILSAALMLEISFGLKQESEDIINAIAVTLRQGYRTGDIAGTGGDNLKVVGTEEIGGVILKNLVS